MQHDEFVGQVQHRANAASRGEAEKIIRVTFETLRDRLLPEAAEHLAAQLPPEIGRHLLGGQVFIHLSLSQFNELLAIRADEDVARATFHAQAVFETLTEAISPGAVKKLEKQLPEEFRSLLHREVLA
jgi:uncharacterized protein (DUF2267 family)